MEVLRGFRELPVGWSGAAVTIGNFDGVHRGHRRVIESARAAAERRDLASLVCTFHPHTGVILFPDRAPEMLQTLEQRLEAIAALDVDACVVIPFDTEIATVSRREFVTDFLVDGLKTRELHVSEGFTFGRDSAGNVEYLEEMTSSHAFRLEVVPALIVDARRVSSTWIRECVADGRMEKAAELLGRPFELVGEVVGGAGRGAGLGAPTANLAPANEILPGRGVYVTEARLDGEARPSVTNVGTRPTFEEDRQMVVETHLLDFEGDLYDRSIGLAFLERLRDEIEFDSEETLRRQVESDVRQARNYFESKGIE